DATLTRLQQGGTEFALLMLDLDGFKSVNVKLGHQAGDALLSSVAERILRTIGEMDVVARLGGDECALLVMPADGTSQHREETEANRLIRIIGSPFDIAGQMTCIGCSIGIALAPTHGMSSDELLKNADLALYKAKNSGRNRSYFYSNELNLEADSRNELEND